MYTCWSMNTQNTELTLTVFRLLQLSKEKISNRSRVEFSYTLLQMDAPNCLCFLFPKNVISLLLKDDKNDHLVLQSNFSHSICHQ